MSRVLKVARPTLLWLLAAGVLCALGLLAPGQAHGATTAPRATCHVAGSREAPRSETWLYGCPSSSQSYNETYCVYPFGRHNTLYGRHVTGNGSISSNNSAVNCTTYGNGNPYHVWIWYDIGHGWNRYQFATKQLRTAPTRAKLLAAASCANGFSAYNGHAYTREWLTSAPCATWMFNESYYKNIFGQTRIFDGNTVKGTGNLDYNYSWTRPGGTWTATGLIYACLSHTSSSGPWLCYKA